jgi:hypothetical protein
MCNGICHSFVESANPQWNAFAGPGHADVVGKPRLTLDNERTRDVNHRKRLYRYSCDYRYADERSFHIFPPGEAGRSLIRQLE